jgi:hypothetical protein
LRSQLGEALHDRHARCRALDLGVGDEPGNEAGQVNSDVLAPAPQLIERGLVAPPVSRLHHRSTLSVGTATISEERGRTFLTVIPEGLKPITGKTVYERIK